KIKNTPTSILLEGSSGTGKELIARAIHYNSNRRNKKFVAQYCGALPETLLESELFGHVKGAYTGAESDRIGRFEAAHKGTIFLDEIGDIPLSVQIKLLRVLEEKMIQRVGTNKSIPIDVRIITATNKNLEQMIEQGQFREDLFFRINVFPLTCPPLRERKDDITLIIQHFISLHAEKTGKNILGFTPEAMRLMVAYRWPGNIRELRNSVEYAFVLAREKSIGSEHLPEKIKNFNLPETKFEKITDSNDMDRVGDSVKVGLSEKEKLLDALQQADGNQTKAAQILGVSRVTIWKRIKKHGIQLK
ncbi:MAG: sigma-54-dependent Fis family transcriptional regulator, partial [Desulfobacteraceae bacterium]|nr:sigma-54-dependent Fis family transcriptional regulator [Desulfobacteraceae bacterium]